jgi:GT2 family glycosyltransferase
LAETLDFSIIVATRDRPTHLKGCLAALAELRYPLGRFEVIVVDDGSAIPMADAVAPYPDHLRLSFQAQAAGGPALARNLGASAAQGRFLAFTDDDCRPAPEWLERLASRVFENPDAIVGGRVVNALEDNLYSAASQALVDYLYVYFNQDPHRAWFLVSANLALAAGIFRSVGGFDPAYPAAAAEDRDLCSRLRGAGYSMLHAPDAIVYHRHDLTLAGFWRQHFGYGRGASRYWAVRRRDSGAGLRMEPPGFYWGMLTYALRQAQVRRPAGVAALLVLSQAANAAGYFWNRFFASR